MAEADSSEERPVPLEHLFYSRTDARGVILSANWVFQRVSGFPWEELIGAPHSFVRHPEMPSGVFHHLWDRLKARKPTAVYVRNRARDGSHYWVLDLLSPLREGYFAIRLKPVSPMLDSVREFYADLRAREREEGLTPEASARLLRAHFAERGFRSDWEFGAAALSAETEARCRVLGRPEAPAAAAYRELVAAMAEVGDCIRQVAELFRGIRLVPSNMRLIAARLEPTGGPISTIAVNYSFRAREMQTWVTDILESRDSGYLGIRDSLARAQFLSAAAALQHEAAGAIVDERRGAAHNDHDVEHALLEELAASYDEDARRALTDLAHGTRRLIHEQEEMKRYVTGLGSTRTLCRVENSRLGEEGGALDGIVEGLDQFQTAIDAQLTRLARQNRAIQSRIAALSRRQRPAAGPARLKPGQAPSSVPTDQARTFAS